MRHPSQTWKLRITLSTNYKSMAAANPLATKADAETALAMAEDFALPLAVPVVHPV